VARFDHHCPWVNNDIGANNLWKFLLFLLLTAAIATYCSYLCFGIFLRYVHEEKLTDKVYVDESGIERKISKFVILQYLLHFNPTLFSLMIFTGIVSFVMYSFVIHQIFLVSQNITSNETFKWEELKTFIEEHGGEISLDEMKKYIDGRMGPLQPEEQQFELAKVSHLFVQRKEKQVDPVRKDNLVNIYDKGILMNFWQLFNYNHK